MSVSTEHQWTYTMKEVSVYHAAHCIFMMSDSVYFLLEKYRFTLSGCVFLLWRESLFTLREGYIYHEVSLCLHCGTVYILLWEGVCL